MSDDIVLESRSAKNRPVCFAIGTDFFTKAVVVKCQQAVLDRASWHAWIVIGCIGEWLTYLTAAVLVPQKKGRPCSISAYGIDHISSKKVQVARNCLMHAESRA